MPEKLPESFYLRPTLEVARDIIGCHIIYNSESGRLSARIVEVEAYIGLDDPACHARVGKTKRNAVMFGNGGYAYIYLIYGIYHCLNFVTEEENQPAALLLRAAEPVEGIELMEVYSPKEKNQARLLAGPGKFCRAFNLNLIQNGLDLSGDHLYLVSPTERPSRIVKTTRIGISQGKDLLYRFYEADSDAVSKKEVTK